MSDMESRWRSLVDAGIAVTSELSLDAALQRIVEVAAELTQASYAALGVIDQSGRRLERFLTTGIDPETHERIGDLPHGRGILGVLIHDAKTLRLHDLTTDPRAVGFPPHHPLMRTFLGAPILLRGVAYGNLYLTEKAGGLDFTPEDEEIVTALGRQAAVAIENARLYESATRWLKQLESLTEVGNALAAETEVGPLLDLIAARLQELINAELVVIALPAASGDLRIEAATGDLGPELVGSVLGRQTSKSGRVLDRRRTERVDSTLDDVEVDQEISRRLGLRSGLFVPLIAADRAIGVVAAHNRLGVDPRFSDEDMRIAETFASRAAVAVEISDRVARDALRRVVEGQELERQRLARELHDETGQSLTSILLGLKQIEDASSPEAAREAAAAVREQVVETLQGVRRLAVELRPKALDDFGLEAALQRLAESWAEQTGIAVEVETNVESTRLPAEVETALYRIVQEALTNVAKHSGASRVSIVVTRRDGAVGAIIEDDGRGFGASGSQSGGLGLVGMKERVGLLDGRLAIESTEGAGTTVAAEVPLR
ncbi:MAG TPA: GAF domain-containing sensor histidine kinase [Gaiellaceae bacterium]|nr:GAF domain-containing sensor histidine kinase [Gaiellaceae bacterium]